MFEDFVLREFSNFPAERKKTIYRLINNLTEGMFLYYNKLLLEEPGLTEFVREFVKKIAGRQLQTMSSDEMIVWAEVVLTYEQYMGDSNVAGWA